MQTTRGISAAMASSIPAAANGGLLYNVSLLGLKLSMTTECVSIEAWAGSLRDEDGSGSCASLLHGITDIGEYRETQVLLTSLLRVCTTNNLGACSVKSCQMLLVVVHRFEECNYRSR